MSLHVTPSAYPPPDPTWTNFFGLNSAAGAAPDGALWLRRENNLRTHNPAITAPCGPDVLPYPGLRQWVVGEEGALTLQNGTAPALCLQLLGRPGPVTWLSAVRCAEVPAGERWVARATAGIGAAAPGDGALWVGSPTNASLCAVYRRDVGRLASQPSPVVTPGLCASPGANASALWYWVRASGELRTEDLPGDERGRCLMGVAPNVNLSLGVAVTLAGPDGASAPAPRQVTTDGRGTASVTVPMHCGQSYQLRTAVLTQRDLQWRGGSVAGARALVRRVDAAGLWAGHQRWWSQYWGINGLVLDPALARLQQLWYSLQYLLGSVVRDGRVTPGLWGPFSNQDPVRWNGQITIDMNAEHAFQGIATLNRLPLLRPYLATMTDPGLRAHGRARAGLSSWARGGYFAQHVRGEQVASVACGPQVWVLPVNWALLLTTCPPPSPPSVHAPWTSPSCKAIMASQMRRSLPLQPRRLRATAAVGFQAPVTALANRWCNPCFTFLPLTCIPGHRVQGGDWSWGWGSTGVRARAQARGMHGDESAQNSAGT